MSATIEFFKAWMRENIGTLPADQEISISVLARQFEDDANAAGYGADVREDEIGDIEEAMVQEIAASRFINEPSDISRDNDLEQVLDALEVEDAFNEGVQTDRSQ